MNDERDETAEADSKPDSAAEPIETVTKDQRNVPTASEPRALTSDDFLVPGPSPESNEGLARWGLTWLVFSLLLIVLMLCVSFACLTLANWTGIA